MSKTDRERAIDPTTPSEELAALASSHPVEVAGNPNAAAEVLEKLVPNTSDSASDLFALVEALGTNPATPLLLLERPNFLNSRDIWTAHSVWGAYYLVSPHRMISFAEVMTNNVLRAIPSDLAFTKEAKRQMVGVVAGTWTEAYVRRLGLSDTLFMEKALRGLLDHMLRKADRAFVPSGGDSSGGRETRARVQFLVLYDRLALALKESIGYDLAPLTPGIRLLAQAHADPLDTIPT